MATVEGKKTGGRSKGVRNKRTRELLQILDAAGYCPIADLIETAELAREEYDRASEIFDAIQDKRASFDMVPLAESTAPTYLKIMQASAASMLPYMYPKLKSTEHTGPNGKDLFQTLSQFFVAMDAQKKLNAPHS